MESGKNWEIIRHEVKWIWFFPKISYVFRADYKINRRIDFVKIQRGSQRDERELAVTSLEWRKPNRSYLQSLSGPQLFYTPMAGGKVPYDGSSKLAGCSSKKSP